MSKASVWGDQLAVQHFLSGKSLDLSRALGALLWTQFGEEVRVGLKYELYSAFYDATMGLRTGLDDEWRGGFGE